MKDIRTKESTLSAIEDSKVQNKAAMFHRYVKKTGAKTKEAYAESQPQREDSNPSQNDYAVNKTQKTAQTFRVRVEDIVTSGINKAIQLTKSKLLQDKQPRRAPQSPPVQEIQQTVPLQKMAEMVNAARDGVPKMTPGYMSLPALDIPAKKHMSAVQGETVQLLLQVSEHSVIPQVPAQGGTVQLTPKRATLSATRQTTTATPVQPPKTAGKLAERTVKTADKATKGNSGKTVKTAETSGRVLIKSSQTAVFSPGAPAMAAAKTAQTTAMASETAKVPAKLTVRTAAATAGTSKTGLILLAVGGIMMLLLVLLVLLLVLLLSPLGIFSAGSDPADPNGLTLDMVQAQADAAILELIETIKEDNADSYDMVEVNGLTASWQDTLAVYAVKLAGNADEYTDVITLDTAKAAVLIQVYQDMIVISWQIERRAVEQSEEGSDAAVWVDIDVLVITLTPMTVMEAAGFYGFSEGQLAMLGDMVGM